jgi:hypothetical protein
MVREPAARIDKPKNRYSRVPRRISEATLK